MRHERKIKAASPVQLELSDFLPKIKRQNIPAPIRFAKLTKRQKNGCVLFTGAVDITTGGYGKFRFDAKTIMLAHRYAYKEFFGNVPDLLRHRCSNPLCVNVAHLMPGTVLENMADMVAAGRQRCALKREQVELIAAMHTKGRSIKDLASQYGVSQKSIYSLVTGKTWSKVTGIKFVPKKPHQRKISEAA